MERHLEISFQDFTPSEWQVESIQQHLKHLEQKFELIGSSRIVVKRPGEHHRKGGLYEINIRLRLPTGKEIEVSRTPKLDERHADFRFALGDAFKRAGRQLQDEVRQLQKKVKAHEPSSTGRIARLFEEYGFLSNLEGLELYFHRNSVLDRAFNKLKPGTLVQYAEEQGEKGPQASTVKICGKHGMTENAGQPPSSDKS